MSSQDSLASPTYYPSSPVGNGHLSPVYCPSSPPGHHAWWSERFPDSFHLECPHPNCPGVLALGHKVEETFAPIDPGVQLLATFHYEDCHTEGNPFNFISYPISCNLGEGCPPEVPYHQDASSVLEAQAQVIQHKVYHGGLVDLYQERQIQALRKEVRSCELRTPSWLMSESRCGYPMLLSIGTLNTLLALITIPCFSPLGTLPSGPVLRQMLDQGVPLPLLSPLSLPLRMHTPPPSSSRALFPEVLPQTGLTTSSQGRSISRVQRLRPSNPYVALQFDLQRILRRKMDQNLDIFEQVFRSVVKEYRDGRGHDVLGCQACFDVGGYCRKSCYSVLHPFHRCPPALDCSCNKL